MIMQNEEKLEDFLTKNAERVSLWNVVDKKGGFGLK